MRHRIETALLGHIWDLGLVMVLTIAERLCGVRICKSEGQPGNGI